MYLTDQLMKGFLLHDCWCLLMEQLSFGMKLKAQQTPEK